MKFRDSLAAALKSLTANKLRSGLTMLGMVIGVAAVIGLMSIGRGAETMITSTFEDLGSNVVWVQPHNPDAPGFAGLSPEFATQSLTMDDAEALADIPSVVAIAPSNTNYAELVAGNKSFAAMIEGSTPAVQQTSNYTLAHGQFFTDRNVAKRDTVVVLGDNAAKELFGSADPLGERIKIKGKRFTVVGVLESKGGAVMGINMDDIAITPITTFQTKLFAQQITSGGDAVESISVQLTSSDAINGAIEDIETVLRKRHRIDSDEKDDFIVVSQEQVSSMLTQVTGVFTIFLGAIAGISLLVGGIGIMNIMLVSVTERTREIGIRKALGAKRRDILVQFLLESAVISLVGSSIGIVCGWFMSRIASSITISGTNIPAVVSPDIVALAISVAIIIGIVSGIYPAMRAARLNPIDALHYG
ncbi:MAG: ABC transporter permease [Dehalococcoidales bacterium]|nr:ABC transporter permease [Dehalococcoidales bacterium]